MAGTQPSPLHLVEEEQKKETAGHWGRPSSQRIMLQCQGSQMEPEPNMKWACSSRSYVWVARKELTSQTHTQIHSTSLLTSPHLFLLLSLLHTCILIENHLHTHYTYNQIENTYINESKNRDCVWPSASPHLRSSGLPLILGKHALPHTPTCSHGWFKASSVVNLDFGSTTNSFLTRSRAKKAENWENHNEKKKWIHSTCVFKLCQNYRSPVREKSSKKSADLVERALQVPPSLNAEKWNLLDKNIAHYSLLGHHNFWASSFLSCCCNRV